MSLLKKIAEWQRENIIDDNTAEQIIKYEQQHSKPMVLWAFGGMGAFAIIVGLVSIIAANWIYAADWLKIAAALLICFSLAVSLYFISVKHIVEEGHQRTEKGWIKEILVMLYYGFSLASMALVGQVYQLGGSISDLLLLWSVVTIPLVLLAQGRFIAVLWVVATATTYMMNINVLDDYLYATQMKLVYRDTLLLALYVLAPVLFILISRIRWLVRHKVDAAETISRFSWLAISVFGFLFQFIWYEWNTVYFANHLIFLCFMVLAPVVYFIPQLYANQHANVHLAMRVVLISVFVNGATAAWFNYHIELVGALSNLLYLCVLAWAAIKIKSTALFNVMTAAISLRILVIYFEVFGSMLETGFGLLIGGVLTLLISWWWFKRSNKLAVRLSAAGE